MKNLLFGVLVACLALEGCTSGENKYNASTYYSRSEQDSVLASIVNYIFTAPPYVSMKDRFEPRHRGYYTNQQLLSQFSIDQYYVSDDGTSYFFVLRPAPRESEKRGVGGSFKLDRDYRLKEFREIYVTPILQRADAKAKGEFLFDKMVKGEVAEYLKMKSYVQWPNDASYYDTTKFEWILDQHVINTQKSSSSDTLSID